MDTKWRHERVDRTWENFEKEFLDKFVPRLVREGRRDEFHSLVQGSMNVADYDGEFTRLLKYVPHFQDDEREKVRLFVKGLNSEVRYSLFGTEMSTYAKAVEKAA